MVFRVVMSQIKPLPVMAMKYRTLYEYLTQEHEMFNLDVFAPYFHSKATFSLG